MFIVDDDRQYVLNIDRVSAISLEGKQIVAETDNKRYIIGRYKDADRAKEVFQELLDKFFPEPPEPVFEDYATSLDSCIVSDDMVYSEPLFTIPFSGESDCKCEYVCDLYATYYMPKEQL